MIFVFSLITMVVASVVDVDLFDLLLPHPVLKNKDNFEKPKFTTFLDHHERTMKFDWWVDDPHQIVTMRVTFDERVPPFDWFALGFSDFGATANADLCLLTFNDDKVKFKDISTTDKELIVETEKNDCLNLHWDPYKRVFQYSRYYDTCEDVDYRILNGTTHVVWARGTSHPDIVHADKGFVRVQLVKVDQTKMSDVPSDAVKWDIKLDKFKVPPVDTTYWCKVFEMPDYLKAKTHHVVRYEPIIEKGNEDLVHHMEVFYCDTDSETKIPPFEDICSKKTAEVSVCSKVKAAWAMGAGPFDYPPQAGLSMGGPKSNKYVMIEVHFNNPYIVKNRVDSSGVRLYLTPKLRPYEAAILEFGLEYIDKMMVPPGQNNFKMTGYCTAACTKIGLPKEGIVVFGSQLHTHLTGIAAETRLFRNGIEIETGIHDPHFSTEFQEIRKLRKPLHIMPGDSLTTTCSYRTLTRDGVTFGGESIQDEMCVNYVHYYPQTNLEVCKSSVNTQSMMKFFTLMKNDGMKTNVNATVRENYNSITTWSQETVDRVQHLFYNAAISMQCNQSDGSRFPGKWERNERDPIVMELEPYARVCPPYNQIP